MLQADDQHNESQDITYFKASVALDQDSYLRQACPSCGLQLKIEANPEDISSLLAPTFRRIEKDHDLILSLPNSHEEDESTLKCPYCGHVDEAQNYLTDELSDYIMRWAERELIYPIRKNFQEELASLFNQSPGRSRNSLISFEIKLEQDDSSIPIRPISGPEPPDLQKAILMCCGKSIKIVEGWVDWIYCPYCSSKLVLL